MVAYGKCAQIQHIMTARRVMCVTLILTCPGSAAGGDHAPWSHQGIKGSPCYPWSQALNRLLFSPLLWHAPCGMHGHCGGCVRAHGGACVHAVTCMLGVACILGGADGRDDPPWGPWPGWHPWQQRAGSRWVGATGGGAEFGGRGGVGGVWGLRLCFLPKLGFLAVLWRRGLGK